MSNYVQQTPLSELLTSNFDGTWGDPPKHGRGVPVIRSTDMRGGEIDYSTPELRSISDQVLERKALRKGDILVNKASGSAHLVGLVAYFDAPDGKQYSCSNFIRCLRPNPEKIDAEFLFYSLQSPQFREQVFGAQRTTSGLRNLKIGEYLGAKITVFPQKEQQRIVTRIQECFSRLEEIERMVEAQVRSFVDLKRALVYGEPGESSSWEVVKHSTKWIQETEKVRTGAKYQFAGVKSFGRGVFSSAQKTSDDFEYGQLRRLKTNDFIYPKLMAWEGAFGMVPEALSGMVVSPEFVVFRTDDSRLLPEVLDTYFRSPACLPEVNSASTGSNRRRRRLNPKAFLELRVPVPPMDRQKKLREVYRLESEMLGDVETTKSQLKALRNAILRQAFAGEL